MTQRMLDYYLIAIILLLLGVIWLIGGATKSLDQISDALQGNVYVNYEATETEN